MKVTMENCWLTFLLLNMQAKLCNLEHKLDHVVLMRASVELGAGDWGPYQRRWRESNVLSRSLPPNCNRFCAIYLF